MKTWDGLNAIQVAGTNGKSSTCAFAASFLQVHRNRTGFPRKRAFEKDVVLKFVAVNSTLPTTTATLKPEAQRINCSLALEVVRVWLALMAPEGVASMEDIITLGVDHFSWPGRYQHISDQNCQWFLDGAHNDLSLQYAVKWFAGTATEKPRYVVISILPLVAPHSNHLQ